MNQFRTNNISMTSDPEILNSAQLHMYLGCLLASHCQYTYCIGSHRPASCAYDIPVTQ